MQQGGIMTCRLHEVGLQFEHFLEREGTTADDLVHRHIHILMHRTDAIQVCAKVRSKEQATGHNSDVGVCGSGQICAVLAKGTLVPCRG